jgi:hypothetical protein
VGIQQVEHFAPTATSDRVCAGDKCHQTEQFELSTSGDNQVILCRRFTSCDPIEQYERTAPTSTSDRICALLTTCDFMRNMKQKPQRLRQIVPVVQQKCVTQNHSTNLNLPHILLIENAAP